MRKIAITGGIASGKSTACQILRELGAYVISADEIVHQLLSPETDIGKKVVALLGGQAGDQTIVNGKILRNRVSEVVFQKRSLLEVLEKLLHPEVQKIIDSHYHEVSQKHAYSLFVAEVPLLFEAHFENTYDAIVLIIADEEKRQSRFIKKGFSASEFAMRESRFLSTDYKITKSNYIIENNSNYDDLKKTIKKIYFELIKEM